MASSTLLPVHIEAGGKGSSLVLVVLVVLVAGLMSWIIPACLRNKRSTFSAITSAESFKQTVSSSRSQGQITELWVVTVTVGEESETV